MARLNVGTGLDNYIEKLGNLELQAHTQMGRAIYEGAKVVADAVKASISTIPTRTKGSSVGVYDYQREGLREGMGISRLKDDNGYWNVKLGFDGYNSHATKKYPKGQPNAMIARSLEKGTSWSPPCRFVSNTTSRVKPQAEAVMQKTLDEELTKTMNS